MKFGIKNRSFGRNCEVRRGGLELRFEGEFAEEIGIGRSGVWEGGSRGGKVWKVSDSIF